MSYMLLGSYATRAGHDINFLGVSGITSTMFDLSETLQTPPKYPATVLGDFGAGTTFAVIGILLALRHRDMTGKGQIIDANIVNGLRYLGMFLNTLWPLHENIAARALSSDAPFYNVYACKDNRYVTV